MRNAGVIATVFEAKNVERLGLSPFCNRVRVAKLGRDAATAQSAEVSDWPITGK